MWLRVFLRALQIIYTLQVPLKQNRTLLCIICGHFYYAMLPLNAPLFIFLWFKDFKHRV